MPRFAPMGPGVLSPEERHPLLPDSGRQALNALLEAPDAPIWNHQCGDRIDRDGLGRVEAFASLTVTDPPRWKAGQRPAWLAGYVEHVRRVVPLYRKLATVATPTSSAARGGLARAWWDLVPDDADLEELIWFPTSGAGHAPVVVPTHPV